MTHAEFAFELLVIAFDAPTQFCVIDEGLELYVLGQSGEPIFCRLRLALRPFDEEPFDWMRRGALFIARRGMHA